MFWPLWIKDNFFFQAEDGIRDTSVTGVQTCALPIYTPTWPASSACRWSRATTSRCAATRSEERRVGKECRTRWGTNYEKKKLKRTGFKLQTSLLFIEQLQIDLGAKTLNAVVKVRQ